MRVLLWLLALFALAAALTVAARYSSGYVLIALPPWRVELSLNLLVLLVLGGYLVFYLLVRFISISVRIPEEVREFRARRRQEKGRRALTEAIGALFVGRFARAEKSAVEALALGESPGLSAVVAARAAHEMRAFDKRDQYLAKAGEERSRDQDLALMAQAELLNEEQRFREALAAVESVQHKHPAVLKLELKLQQKLGNWDRVLQLASGLGKRRALDPLAVEQLTRRAHFENIRQRSLEAPGLKEYWQKIPPEEQRDNKIASIAAQSFIGLGDCHEAHEIIEQSLETSWDSELAALYSECAGQDLVQQIERAEKWLPAHPDDAVLLLTLGKLCARQGLWGKAESYLEASLSVDAGHSAHLALAELMEQRGHHQRAAEHYRKGLELALAQLKTNTGGRRRTVV